MRIALGLGVIATIFAVIFLTSVVSPVLGPKPTSPVYMKRTHIWPKNAHVGDMIHFYVHVKRMDPDVRYVYAIFTITSESGDTFTQDSWVDSIPSSKNAWWAEKHPNETFLRNDPGWASAVAMRYYVTATLYYSDTSLPPGDPGWATDGTAELGRFTVSL